eukprot:g43621.t1
MQPRVSIEAIRFSVMSVTVNGAILFLLYVTDSYASLSFLRLSGKYSININTVQESVYHLLGPQVDL